MNSRKQGAKSRKPLAKSAELKAKCKNRIAKNQKLCALCSTLFALCSTLLALCLCSCAIPRIIVLDDPLSPEEHLNLGVTYENQGELENALKEYKAASKKVPLAYLYMGNVYFQKKEYEEAEFYYKKTIKKDPVNADACNNLAWLYYTERIRLDEAERLALKALELNPSKKEIYLDTLEKIRSLR